MGSDQSNLPAVTWPCSNPERRVVAPAATYLPDHRSDRPRGSSWEQGGDKPPPLHFAIITLATRPHPHFSFLLPLPFHHGSLPLAELRCRPAHSVRETTPPESRRGRFD